uniref:LisH domain-containing protein n=1 Tax=Cajanus cajan TaxID=3821 RepID=A0A151RWL1_CAJCA|nr:hypothetical protein KK1_031423 [Cajanus cajan]
MDSLDQKMNPNQLAFLVYRYLSLNKFFSSRTHFLKEANPLIANAIINKEVPSSVMSLAEMMDEYVSLKKQVLLLNQEKAAMMQEKNIIRMLLQGNNLINTNSAIGIITPSPHELIF